MLTISMLLSDIYISINSTSNNYTSGITRLNKLAAHNPNAPLLVLFAVTINVWFLLFLVNGRSSINHRWRILGSLKLRFLFKPFTLDPFVVIAK